MKLNTDISKFCIECGDQDADTFCQDCQDQYCSICWGSLHKRGTRALHVTKKIVAPSAVSFPDTEMKAPPAQSLSEVVAPPTENKESSASDNLLDLEEALKSRVLTEFFIEPPTGAWFEERAHYVPIRLTEQERALLLLVESAMDVSEYTDKVDVWSYRYNKSHVMISQLRDLCNILTGLSLISDPKAGRIYATKSYKDNEAMFQHVLEVARRHKIRNPEKMRSSYGKLIHILMDCQDDDIKSKMEFQFVSPIRTVYSTLAEREGGLELLRDRLLPLATGEILLHGKSQEEVTRAVEARKKAVEVIVQKYTTAHLPADDIRMCISSIGDNHSFLVSNRDPVDKMIHYLTTLFSPSKGDTHSLAISSGRGGSCLSHDHRTHYFFVLQSLTLWQEIAHNMFKLWCYAEGDLLDPQSMYRLQETGQGLQRMQRCPRVWKGMSDILSKVHHSLSEKGLGSWVGLSVVHLGDRDVPNALIFIDKYNQISRILTPIVTCLRELERLYNNGSPGFPGFKEYVDNSFQSLEGARMTILQDFFRHGFDGSGDDGGSCIDGRLTSCWNWCSLLSKKSYYNLFLFTGFLGFDGEF